MLICSFSDIRLFVRWIKVILTMKWKKKGAIHHYTIAECNYLCFYPMPRNLTRTWLKHSYNFSFFSSYIFALPITIPLLFYHIQFRTESILMAYAGEYIFYGIHYTGLCEKVQIKNKIHSIVWNKKGKMFESRKIFHLYSHIFTVVCKFHCILYHQMYCTTLVLCHENGMRKPRE